MNPAIYSAHLRLHPLLVLTVLVIAEHSLGMWGLLLAVPMTVFALDYCIRCAAAGPLSGCAARSRGSMTMRAVSNAAIAACGDQLATGCTEAALVCRYPQDTMHDVATKELEYVRGYGDSIDEAYLPSPGFTPEDGYIPDSNGNVPDDAMSPEARDLLTRAAAIKMPREPDGLS